MKNLLIIALVLFFLSVLAFAQNGGTKPTPPPAPGLPDVLCARDASGKRVIQFQPRGANPARPAVAYLAFIHDVDDAHGFWLEAQEVRTTKDGQEVTVTVIARHLTADAITGIPAAIATATFRYTDGSFTSGTAQGFFDVLNDTAPIDLTDSANLMRARRDFYVQGAAFVDLFGCAVR